MSKIPKRGNEGAKDETFWQTRGVLTTLAWLLVILIIGMATGAIRVTFISE